MFKIYVNNRQEYLDIDELQIERLVDIIYEAGELERLGELSISLIDDEEMAQLNESYRFVEGTTDVLSFPQDEGMEVPLHCEDPDYVPLIGDVLISVPRALKQAEEAGHSFDRELRVLLIHGILHLYGYDHDNIYQQLFMQEEEKAILKALEETEKALKKV